MQAFPFLLQQLDAFQDKFVAAAESNEILKSALEQMQPPVLPESNELTDSRGNRDDHQIGAARHPKVSVPAEAYLRLARENYLLSGPYQIDLLTGYTGAIAFSDFPSPSLATAIPKAKKFAPFRVVGVVKRNDNQQGEEEQATEEAVQLAIVADANDANGTSYLNRSKINAFLHFIQGKAAKKAFKELVFTKLAEFITKLRELKSQFAAETTAQRATIQMLQREVDELKHALKHQVDSLGMLTTEATSTTASGRRASPQSRRKLLMKLIDLYVEKQQQHRQSTFLTQTTSSDVLISNASALEPCEKDCLDISDCGIDDNDVVEVLLRIQVSGVAFHEIRLDANLLTDTGATHLANFFEKCPTCVKIVSIDGNAAISYHGVEAIKRGLLRNASIQRIEMDPSSQVIEALETQDDFALHGIPTVVFRVFLPRQSHGAAATSHMAHASDEDVNQMVDRMHQMGFTDLFTRSTPPAAFSVYAGATNGTRKKRAAFNGARAAPAPTPSAVSRRQIVRKQQEQKFQNLEAAIRKAAAPQGRVQAETHTVASRSRHNTIPRSSTTRSNVSASLTQRFSGIPIRPHSASATYGSSRSIYGKAHLATVRGLQR